MCGRALRLRVVLTAFRRICRQRRCLEARSLARPRYAIASSCSQASTSRMAQSTRIQNYKAGQTIVIEGRVGAAFFIVIEAVD